MTNAELEYMELAIREARRSRFEGDNRIHPFVGVVVVREDEVLASACRGDRELGEHAEFIALEQKLQHDTLAGATIYTTLEPCTTRSHPKVPCAVRLVERRVARVVIGLLDPDQRITGKGVICLRHAGVSVDLFPPNLMAQIEELNREFIRDRELVAQKVVSSGVVESGLSAFYPSRRDYGRLGRGMGTIDKYVSSAEESAILVSVNLMTGIPFDDLCACLQAKISMPRSKFRATISLLDPRQAELMSVMGSNLNMEADDLARSIRNSLARLLHFKEGLPRSSQSRVTLRVHKSLPSGSAILLDHEQTTGRIQIETKPYKAGLQASFAFEVVPSEPGGLYDVLAKAYNQLLEDGELVGPESI